MMLKLMKIRPQQIGRFCYSTNVVNSTSLNSFNSNHVLYDKVRPSYDASFVQHFLKDLNLVDPQSGEAFTDKPVLELAAGTGKFTQHLVKSGWGDNLTVVEPSSGMIESFKKKLPTVSQVLEGSSYKIPAEDNTYDAVIVAQGFHWFADHESLEELNRVLKPQGKLGLIWNFDASSRAHMLQDENFTNFKFLFEDEKFKSVVEDYLLNEVIAKEIEKGTLAPERRVRRLIELLAAQTRWDMLANYVYQYGQNVPQYYQGKWRRAFKNQSLFKNSTILETYMFRYPKLPRDLVYPYWESRSYITEKSDAEKLAIKEKIEEMLNSFEDFAFADDAKTDVMMFLGSHYFVVDANK